METNKIIQGDCLEVLKTLPDESVDFILADYPFNCQDGRKDYFEFVKKTADEFYRVLKLNGNLLVLNNPINIFKTSSFYHQFNYRNGIALIRKGSLRPAWMFGFQHNYALILYKGNSKKEKWNGATTNHDKSFLTDVIEYQNGFRGKGKMWHPQAIPLELTKTFVSVLSDHGDVVLDPFLGSGTTAVACVETGRNFIGIELKPEYVKIAHKRLRPYLEQTKLTEVTE